MGLSSQGDSSRTGDTPPQVGTFQYFKEGDLWLWSPAVAAMHGYEPGTVEPTTELILSHKHPDDVATVSALLERVRHADIPFSSRHRIIDTAGRVRRVVVVGDRVTDGAGTVIGTSGFYIDVTADHAAEVQSTWDDAVAAIAASRAHIEQAKGMLMLVYGIGADQAFDVLRWRSQETNVKLRAFAAALARLAPSRVAVDVSGRQDFDHVLLTIHEDIEEDTQKGA